MNKNRFKLQSQTKKKSNSFWSSIVYTGVMVLGLIQLQADGLVNRPQQRITESAYDIELLESQYRVEKEEDNIPIQYYTTATK